MELIKSFLAIGIAVIFAVFIAYGLYTIYPQPSSSGSYTSSCYTTYDCYKQVQDCEDNFRKTGSEGYSNCYDQVQQSSAYKACMNLQKECVEQAETQNPRYIYSRNCFYILLLIGLAAIVWGIVLSAYEGIGSGFLGGGILIILYSLFYTYRYWYTFPKYIKLLALGIVLIILVVLGYRKLERRL